jgi:hypothetical protein
MAQLFQVWCCDGAALVSGVSFKGGELTSTQQRSRPRCANDGANTIIDIDVADIIADVMWPLTSLTSTPLAVGTSTPMPKVFADAQERWNLWWVNDLWSICA